MAVIKTKFPLFAIKHTGTLPTYSVCNIIDHDGDGFYGLVTLIFYVNPQSMFSMRKFGKKVGTVHE
jgi:hypothetical protein